MHFAKMRRWTKFIRMKLRHAAALVLAVLGLDSCAHGDHWGPAYHHPWLVAFVILVVIGILASIVGGRSNRGAGVKPLPPDPPN